MRASPLLQRQREPWCPSQHESSKAHISKGDKGITAVIYLVPKHTCGYVNLFEQKFFVSVKYENKNKEKILSSHCIGNRLYIGDECLNGKGKFRYFLAIVQVRD